MTGSVNPGRRRGRDASPLAAALLGCTAFVAPVFLVVLAGPAAAGQERDRPDDPTRHAAAACARLSAEAGIETPYAQVSMPHAPRPHAQAILAQAEGAGEAAGGEAAGGAAEPAGTGEDEGALADELAAMLQACSYDGAPLSVSAEALAAGREGAGADAVAAIMKFTGLPQNFKVVEGNVPNAAAMIVLGPQKIPERVIAYNAGFMRRVREATLNSDWAALSIMAHEIGHHLSGHTLVPGGSQPPVELEADKFSGFVLSKMGAALDEAQKAVATLVPEADGPTHPGRVKRLAAVEAGWSESCGQQPGGCAERTAEGAVAAAPATGPETLPAGTPPAGTLPAGMQANDGAPDQTAGLPPLTIPGAGDIRMPGEHPASGGDAPIPPEALDRMPRLDAAATPAKFDRFVYDEVGVFHPQVKKGLADRAYAFSARHGVEIVTIVARDLQGRTAEAYALDAMRQLRVGKLDVGNGAVLVVAPNEKQGGVALGPGLRLEYEGLAALNGYLDDYLQLVQGGARPQIASEMIVDASSRVMRDSQAREWAIRYQSLDAMLAAGEAYQAQLKASGARYDPTRDPVTRRLARIRATVVTKTPDPADRTLRINAVKARDSGPAMHVRTADGTDAILYVNPAVTALMPTELVEGKDYAFVVRDTILAGEPPQFDLISYDPLR